MNHHANGVPVKTNSKRIWIFWFCALLLLNLLFQFSVEAASTADQIAALKTEKNEAIFKVQHIVNQPVTRMKRTPDMRVSIYSPGWFHAGAITPNFNTVDIRKSQEFPYLGHQYVTSDLNPGFVFLGAELEFNSMTKYFYTDRSQPKKRLSEDEMVEINSLYRTIGRCETEINALENPPPLTSKIHGWLLAHKPVVGIIVVALISFLILIRKMKSNEA